MKNKMLDYFENHKFRFIDQTGENRPPISSEKYREDLNNKGYEAYFTVNGFANYQDNRKEQCINLNSFFVDIDGRKDQKELEQIKDRLMPTFITETKNGYHIYWLLDEVLYKEDYSQDEWSEIISKWEKIEQNIVTALNADPAVKDVTRILRVPNSFYWKKTGEAYKEGIKDDTFVITGIHKHLSATYPMDKVYEIFPDQIDKAPDFPKTQQGKSMQKYADAEKKNFFDLVNKAYPIEDRPSFQALISGKEDTMPPNLNSRNEALLITASLMRQAGWTKERAISHFKNVGWHGIEKERGGLNEIISTINSAFNSGYTYSYKNEIIAFNMTPEEQSKISIAYTSAAKTRKEVDKTRFSNYEYEIASRYPYLKKNEIGIIFNYQDGVYKMLSDQDISNIILNMFHEDMLWGYKTKKNVQDKIACLVAIIPDLVLSNKPDFFNVKNGLYQFSTGQLVPHTPDFVSLVQSPVEFDPNATCPYWLECLNAWMEGDEKEEKIKILQQFAGYLLTPSMVHAKALFLVGDGGNGKSTFADTLGMVIGEQGTSRIDLEDLYGTFGLKGLIGKRLNIIEEVGGNYYQSHKLKKLISGEELTINMKFKDQFKFRPTAKFIFAVNTMPRVDDSSSATERRISVVQFNNNFRNNPNIALRFSDGLLAKELSGILNWMIEGEKMLRESKVFVITSEQKSILSEYREENSSVDGFAGECLEYGEGYCVSSRSLYDEYKEYCVKDGRKFKSAIAFTKEMRAIGKTTGKFEYHERKNGTAQALFEGIKIDKSWNDFSLNSYTEVPVKRNKENEHDL